MKVFSQALLVAVIAATAAAKKGKMFEANAYVTPKHDTPNIVDPYLKQNYLNLRQVDPEEVAHDVTHAKKEENVETHIVRTSDIDNYFNLQITTKLYFGSNQEPHDLILDTGSMVSLEARFLY